MAESKSKKSDSKTKKSSSTSSKSTGYNKYRCVRDYDGDYKTEHGVRVKIEKVSTGVNISSGLPHGQAKKKSNFIKNKNLKKVNS